ncbi:polymorphic toxin type 23 domain-containing protein [Riemerella anatipestifer]|uniref:polymorphic toxin type 23 domain-containing protein n=1 Tax=Riemerella anatipestifer TaxID=34085 RepID=UPI0021AA2C02|nr:polymorphic toxin type 23 domain-containing protein [Riemerella anatipestifer]
MKKLYSLLTLICSLGFGQTILNQPENSSRTVEDPNTIILTNGFHAKGNNVFVARIGENVQSSPSPSDSNAGISNPNGTIGTSNFHDTQGNIEVTASGQLQYTLPIALPPGVKSVAPQINLVYTSGSGNGIAGYGWNLSGITAISRMGKTIEKDGKVEGIKLNYDDYYSFNGQRLILKSGEYGKNGAEYITEKYSNVKIKSLGSINGYFQGPEYWEVTFEDGSQAWYGTTSSARTPIEYNIVKWKDAQGNYITYNYTQSNNVAAISSIEWGGNEALNKPHFNKIEFAYINREIKEISYTYSLEHIQEYLLKTVQVITNGNLFKKYVFQHKSIDGYPRVEQITEYNSESQAANPIVFSYQEPATFAGKNTTEQGVKNTHTKKYGDFDFDGVTDFLEMEYNGALYYKNSVYKDDSSPIIITYNRGEFSVNNFRDAAIVTYKNNNIVGTSAGIVIPVKKYKENSMSVYDYEFRIYSVNLQNKTLDFQYSKTLKYEDFKTNSEPSENTEDNLGCHTSPTTLSSLLAYDYDGDGISEILAEFSYSRECFFSTDPFLPTPFDQKNKDSLNILNETKDISKEQIHNTLLSDNTEYYITQDNENEKRVTYNYIRPPEKFQPISEHQQFTLFLDLKQDTPYEQSFYKFNHKYSDSYIYRKPFEIADFNGDGIDELYIIENDNLLRDISNIKKSPSGQYSFTPIMSNQPLSGLVQHAIKGDFNGDGKIDLAVPQAQKSYHWKFYFATGSGFKEYYYNGFIYFSSQQEITNEDRHNTFLESGCVGRTITYYQYSATDLDNDGKSEITVSKVVIRNHDWNAHNDRENTSVTLDVYSVSKPKGPYRTTSFGTSTNLPLRYNLTKSSSYYFGGKVIYFQPLFINKTNQQIILVGRPDDCPTNGCDRINAIYLDYENLPTKTRMASIEQGNLRTNITYEELLPRTIYQPMGAISYPYISLNKVNQSYVVSNLYQEGRKQDFRYRGLLSHLQGRGMIGFRQTARSSWYTDEFRNTIVWSGAEIDPHQEGVPIKEWSIKTTNEAEIFPSDLSFSNPNLLTLKTTEYKTDLLVDGAKVDAITDTNRNRIVKALVPVHNTSKDFIKDVTTKSTITYDNYYLPIQTVTQTIGDSSVFATASTNLEYYPPNLSATGKDYHVGRPRSKTELMQAYGDSKGAKEEYTYENNLLKTLKTWNRDNSGWLQETYDYDGFGNIIQKTITNSVDSHTQNSKTEYEDKGRFVVRKTDNLGLVTHITYNDWGQVLTQTDPLGNQLTNTYDAWGKLLTAKTNLGGVSTYTYEKLGNGDTKTTEYSPDGSVSISFTNKIGQTYKSTSKAFGNQWVSKSVIFDGLGRKTNESEPYFDHQSPTQWNTIEYDEYSRPIKATAFTGKIVTTQYTQNTVTTTETNANNRFKKQTFDALGNISTSADKGGTITFKYNAAGEQIEVKYGTNTVTTKYDAWGRKIEFNDPSNGIYRYEYNGFGQNTKTISPKGTKTYTYNTKGQLVSQRELSNDNTNATDKSISYTYNAKGLVVKKSGVSKGKTYTSSLVYDGFGRVLSSSEENNGRYFMQKDIVYDDKNRVISYEKSLYSGGTYTKALIENIYDPWSGALYQLKDKTSGKVLWQLQQHNAKGQVTQAKLGASTIENTYDTNGFLTNINHSSARKPSILQISYRFDAIKNELNSRTTGGDFNILESFTYDENNRLTNWTNPVTGQMHHNIYDAQGRIIENDQLGKISFGNSQKIYQPTAITLNATGEQNLKNDLVQQISYNENNDPLLIQGVKGDLRFEYGLSSMRQVMTFGGKIANGSHGKLTRYYSEDGSYEVTLDHATGREKHTLYIGGSPYESDIIYLKNYTESQASYKFLHKDYLGSILAISDEAGNKLEQRHYDAWGNLTHLKIGEQTTITDKNQIKDYLASSNLITDRGYTSHEHLAEVGLIHMNGRLYDPLLRRFLNADENIQDAFNTQNYNKYGYVLNNPLMYNDPSGEIFFFAILTPILGEVLAGVVAGAIAGAIVGATSYVLSAVISSNWNWGSFAKSILMGAISGAISGGMNPGIFSSAAGTLYRMGGQAISSILPSWNISIGNFDFNFSPSIAIGKGWGFGANISATFRSGDFAISAGIGIMNYGAHEGSGNSGIEFRKSAMLNYDDGNFGLGLGLNNWNGGITDGKGQQTGFVNMRWEKFAMSYENDGTPFQKDVNGFFNFGDGGDSYRTARALVGYAGFSAGVKLFTGLRDSKSFYAEEKTGSWDGIANKVGPATTKNRVYYPNGIVMEQGNKYRLGALYISYKNYNIGINSDRHVIYPIQGLLIHNSSFARQRAFEVLSNAINPYLLYQTKNKFTSW